MSEDEIPEVANRFLKDTVDEYGLSWEEAVSRYEEKYEKIENENAHEIHPKVIANNAAMDVQSDLMDENNDNPEPDPPAPSMIPDPEPEEIPVVRKLEEDRDCKLCGCEAVVEFEIGGDRKSLCEVCYEEQREEQ